MDEEIKEFTRIFLEKIDNEKIHLISHFDTDGITSAAIMSKTLEKLNKQFSLKILKQLDEKEIHLFPKDKVIILLDLGSSSLEELSKLSNQIIIIDHHEITLNSEIPNIHIFNPHLSENYEDLCSAELTYLISKKISEENKDLAHLSILGMIGDTMEKNITKTRNQIINNANVTIKRGLLLYPSTRPLDKTLEYCSRPFIPGITGNPPETYKLLNEAGIKKIGKKFKALIDLNEQEMKNLVTCIMLRLSSKETEEYLGNLYLLKFFNKVEDARELSAIINACSRMDKPEIALLMCLGNLDARKKAERIYVKYRQHIISGLKHVDSIKKIQGKEYIIINAQEKIKDTIIGTITSIISFSKIYTEGTIIIGMAHNDERIKISARIVGRSNTSRNLKKLLDSVIYTLGSGIVGGHKMAAGGMINKKDETKFIEILQKKLEIEMIKI